jgi:hypothetical protein
MVKLCGSVYEWGTHGGLQALIHWSLFAVWTHWIICKKGLVFQRLSLELENVIKININVDYIKSRPVRARIFACLCDVMGAEHTSLILYCELRWLSLGNVLKTNARFESRCYQYLTEVSYDSACMFNVVMWGGKFSRKFSVSWNHHLIFLSSTSFLWPWAWMK